MLRKIRFVTGAVLAFAASLAFADSVPKSIEIKVEGANKYSHEAFTMGGVELVGYLGDQKDVKGLEAVVYVGKPGADREAELAKLAARAGLKAFVKEGGKVRSIDIKPGE